MGLSSNGSTHEPSFDIDLFLFERMEHTVNQDSQLATFYLTLSVINAEIILFRQRCHDFHSRRALPLPFLLGEGSNKRRQIIENIQFIANTMKENRTLIAKLRQQLRESSIKGEQLKRSVENLVAQLEEKEQQLQQLRAELDAKDIHISELDATINTLNTNVSSLQEESSKKTETINAQDKQLNTAWFVFGTKKELKEQRILDGDKVLESNFNKSYFTKIDIRVEKEIKFYSKSAKILTMHPSGSYTLQRNAQKQYVLRITNPQIFWSTSKYLVVVVK